MVNIDIGNAHTAYGLRGVLPQSHDTVASRGTTGAIVDNAQSMMANMADDAASLMAMFGRLGGLRSSSPDRSERTDRGERHGEFDKSSSPKIERLDQVLDARHDARRFLAFARRMFPDPTDLALALSEMLRQRRSGMRREGDTAGSVAAQERVLELARAILLEEDGARISNAEINAAPASIEHAGELGISAKKLRTAYRMFASGELSDGFMYQYLMEQVGFRNTGRALAFIETAFVADQNAVDPSCSEQEFGNLLPQLLRLRLLRSSEQIFIGILRRHGLFTRVASGDSRDTLRLDAHDAGGIRLMIEGIRAPAAVGTPLTEFIGNLGRYSDDTTRLQLVQTVLSAFSALPFDVFPDDASASIQDEPEDDDLVAERVHAPDQRLRNRSDLLAVLNVEIGARAGGILAEDRLHG